MKKVNKKACNYAKAHMVFDRDALVKSTRVIEGLEYPRDFYVSRVIYINDMPLTLKWQDYIEFAKLNNEYVPSDPLRLSLGNEYYYGDE